MTGQLDRLRSAVLTRHAPGDPEPDPAMLADVFEDPRFVRRLKRGALDLTAMRDALLVARHRLWAETIQGNAIDGARQKLQADRRARAGEYRRARGALKALLSMMENAEPSGQLKNLGRWRITGADPLTLRQAVHHGRAFVEALCRVYPALALDYPEIPAAPLVRRTGPYARDPSAPIQKWTRAALKRAGLQDDLAARLMRAAGIRRA